MKTVKRFLSLVMIACVAMTCLVFTPVESEAAVAVTANTYTRIGGTAGGGSITKYYVRFYQQSGKWYVKAFNGEANYKAGKSSFTAAAQKKSATVLYVSGGSTSLTFNFYSGNRVNIVQKGNNVAGFNMSGNYYGYSSNASVKPTSLTCTNTSQGVKVQWYNQFINGSYRPEFYAVYKKTGSGAYKLFRVVDRYDSSTYKVSGNYIYFIDTAVSQGTQYSYKIVAYIGSKPGAELTKSVYRLLAPTGVSSKKILGTINLQWYKNKYASTYYVYRKQSGSNSYTVFTVGSSNYSSLTGYYTFKDKSAVKGKTYTYYVVVAAGGSNSANSATTTITK